MRGYFEIWGRAGPELVPLEADRSTIGRAPTNDVALEWDSTVSELHAVVERYPVGWCVRDVGSSNGTFVNGERLVAERRLRANDEVRVGGTRLVFRLSQAPHLTETSSTEGPPPITRREKEVLVTLCRPIVGADGFAQPATVRQMADDLVVGEAAIKFHLSNLYAKFGIEEGSDSRRVRLANEAIRRRAITLADLRGSP